MTLIEWLNSCPNMISTGPVTVRIGDKVYKGVRYVQFLDNSHQTESIIFLGKRPKFKNRTCFRLKDTTVDWYPSWYSPDVIKPEFQQYHPCGHVWTIAPWTPKEPIDRYEKYHRQNLEIQYETSMVDG